MDTACPESFREHWNNRELITGASPTLTAVMTLVKKSRLSQPAKNDLYRQSLKEPTLSMPITTARLSILV